MAQPELLLLCAKVTNHLRPSVPISRSTLSFYGLPAIPLAALSLPLYVIVPAFYTEQLGLSLSIVGITLFFIRLFDAASDPFFGWGIAKLFNVSVLRIDM